ncbi:ABC transporter permease [Paracoccus sp. TK19116]|uniref:Transport permease protein n=1 Tax=Paracoccus albicereus TaxID=2922394 RepID=A0ABT1MS14_9RHOB|nr:ABC transporter permease [Paracoccus albicereus]MCQ0970143.1 ABC transporter permease [Paracoccus albicereus]
MRADRGLGLDRHDQCVRPRVSGLRTTVAMMLREMSTSHGRATGGYFWAIIDPIAGIALMTLVFSIVMRNPPIGTNFVIFYATGYVPFSLYGKLTNKMGGAISSSRSLLAYPAVTVTDALLSRAMVTILTEIVVTYLIFSFILLSQETRTDPDIATIAVAIAMCISLAFGIGTINAFLFSAFPEWMTIWSVLNRPLFIISCVFFIYDNVPHPYDKWLWFNPLVHVIGQMRKGFYHSYSGDYVSVAYVFGLAAVLSVIGLALVTRYHREIVNEW